MLSLTLLNSWNFLKVEEQCKTNFFPISPKNILIFAPKFRAFLQAMALHKSKQLDQQQFMLCNLLNNDKLMVISICLDSVSVSVSARFTSTRFLFFFFYARVSLFQETQSTVQSLFTGPTTTLFKKNFKNGSYGTIHTFKNYFATVFSVFNKISCIQTGP